MINSTTDIVVAVIGSISAIMALILFLRLEDFRNRLEEE